jgi:hypothetical protein
MTATATKQFEISIVYNGVTKPITVNPEQAVQAVREHAIHAFGITQNPHLLSLFTDQGAELADTASVESAGIAPGATLLLRPSAVRAG